MAKIPASERDAFYEERRNLLADVALRLWAERGFDQTSVAAIASEAGVSKGSFYLYFESKEALLEDVLRRNSLVPNVQQLIDGLHTLSLEEAIHAFVKGAWQHLSEKRELVLVLMRELPTHLDRAQQLLERVMLPANELLAGYLAERVGSERAAELDLILSGRALVGMIGFVFLTQEILGAQRVVPRTADDVATALTELFLRGVAPESACAASGSGSRGEKKPC